MCGICRHGNCYHDGNGLASKSLDVRICGLGNDDTIVVNFGECSAAFTANTDGIFRIVKPSTGCGDEETLNPDINVQYEEGGAR